MDVIFTKHAREKFEVLKLHGVEISEAQVLLALSTPDVVDKSRLPLLIAQISFDSKRVLRVVFKYEQGIKKIITFYPGRKKAYQE